jgi:hypothetical protein
MWMFMILLQEIPRLPGWHFAVCWTTTLWTKYFLTEKIQFVRNWKSKVKSDDNETTTTQYQYELYICRKIISLAFKHAPYELCTEQVIIFNKDDVSKKSNFLWYSHTCSTETAGYRVLKFCKKGARLTHFSIGWKTGVQFPVEIRDFSLFHSVQTSSGPHLPS